VCVSVPKPIAGIGLPLFKNNLDVDITLKLADMRIYT